MDLRVMESLLALLREVVASTRRRMFVAMFLAGFFTTKMSVGSRKHRVAMVTIEVVDEMVIIAVVIVAVVVVSTAGMDKEEDIEMVTTSRALVKVTLCRFKKMHRLIGHLETKISVHRSVKKATSVNKGKVIRNHRQTTNQTTFTGSWPKLSFVALLPSL